MRVLWTRPVSIFLCLFGPLIKQDRRADRRETFVDSAKCQERSTRGLLHRRGVGLDGTISYLFLELEAFSNYNN